MRIPHSLRNKRRHLVRFDPLDSWAGIRRSASQRPAHVHNGQTWPLGFVRRRLRRLGFPNLATHSVRREPPAFRWVVVPRVRS